MHTHDAAATRRQWLTDRVGALEDVLTARGLVTATDVDDIVDLYRARLGPRRGAALVARAWTDPAFRARLLADATEVITEFGYDGRGTTHSSLPFLRLVAVENTADVHNLVVCTLCSCYPLALLGPPPRWYKSAEYRDRAIRRPREVLAEFGVELPAGVRVRVWDSTADCRYLVIPQRPPGTEDLTADELAALVTPNSMIGTDRDLAAAR